MSLIKGGIPKALLDQQAFIPLIKKCDDYRKVTLNCQKFYGYLIQVYERQIAINDRAIVQLTQIDKDACPDSYKVIKSLFTTINQYDKQFVQTMDESHKQMANCFQSTFLDLSNSIINFQQFVINYQSQQQEVLAVSRKYSKALKNIELAIQNYKDALVDVKLVYNDPQKIKRYETCESQFEKIVDQYNFLDRKVKELADRKILIVNCFQSIQNDFIKAIRVVCIKTISEAKNFMFQNVNRVSNFINKCIQGKKILERSNHQTLFCTYKQKFDPNIFNAKMKDEQSFYIPKIISEHEKLKDDQILVYNQSLVRLVEQIQVLVSQRKVFNTSIIEFIQTNNKNVLKNMLPDMKNTLVYLNKIKKRVTQFFGQQTYYFLKSIQSSFELSISLNQKMIKKTDSLISKINSQISDYSKQLDKFLKQFNSIMEKFFSKKEVRSLYRNSSQSKSYNEKQSETSVFSPQQIQKYKAVLHSTMKDVMKSFISFQQKLDRIDIKIKVWYAQLCANTIDIQSSLHKAILEDYNKYFNEQNFLINYKKFEEEISKIIQAENQFFKTCVFEPLKTDKSKITIDLQKHKFQQFLKLKKPIENFQAYRQSFGMPNLTKNTSQRNIDQKEENLEQKNQLEQRSKSETLNSQKEVSQNKENKHKYQDLIRSKVMFKQGQAVINYYRCSVSDKIILNGRLFVTNLRLCFYSKFNPSNVFFGGTLIQIPKEYILKVKKRKTLFVDSGLILTTIHGDISFYGFYNRDQVYDLILSTFQIKAENQPLQQNDEDPQADNQIELLVSMEDDINEQQIKQRKLIIQQKLENGLKFNDLSKTEIKKINPYQLLKIFFSDQQITVNKRTFPCFQHYFRTSLQHTDVQIQNWLPSLKQFLNPINIKNTTPQVFKRISKSMSPLKSTGLPFMPKFVKSVDEEQLFIFDRDHWVIISKAVSFGVPYSDCFQVFVKLKVESKGQDSCMLVAQYYVNFVKSTVMSSLIQQKAKQEILSSLKKRVEQINKHISYLENLRNKNKGAQKGQEVQEQPQKEKAQLVEKNQDLEKKLDSQICENAKLKKIILALGILNLILFICLMF